MEKVLRYKTLTKENIVKWYDSDPSKDIGISTLNPVEFGTYSLPVFIPDEYYNLYLNFDKDLGITENSQFILLLEDMHGEDKFVFPFSIKKYRINGVWQLYLSFKILKYSGLGRFKIVDDSGTVWFVSQRCLFGSQFINNTNYFEFSNDRDLGNFYYSSILDQYGDKIYQRVRLIIANDSIDVDQEIKQYRNSTNRALRNVNFDTDVIYKLKGVVMSEDTCLAISIGLSPCKEIYVNGIGLTTKTACKISKKENTEGFTIEMNLYVNKTMSNYIPPFAELEREFDIVLCELNSIVIIKQVI